MRVQESIKEKFGSAMLENISVRKYTSLNSGGVVDFLLEVGSMMDLITAIKLCHEEKIPFLLIGGGSNIIFSDFGFNGVVIKNNCQNISIIKDKSQVIVDSGVELGKLIMLCASINLGGLEHLVNVPGTIGGLIAKSYPGQEHLIIDNIKKITIINKNNEVLTFKNSWLRERIIKGINRYVENKYIILTVLLQLRNVKQENIIRKIRAEMIAKKKNNSFISGEIFKDSPTINVAQLITKSKAHKLTVGDAIVDQTSYNRIINLKDAKSSDVRRLVEMIREQVTNKTGHVLEEKIAYVGVW